VALTAGEEAEPDYNGVEWLLHNRRDLIDAAYCINMDAGDPQIQNGRRTLRTIQASEKVSFSFHLEVKHAGGHSSLPTKDNAIYRLSAGLGRLAGHQFPVSLNDVTRTYFLKMAALKEGQLAADMKAVTGNPPDAGAVQRLSASPYYNALLRTTCVATEINGGHAINALPQVARAGVNCRMLPDESPADVERTLIRVVEDDQIAVSGFGIAQPSPASPLVPEVMEAIERTTVDMWPGIPVVPVMETGATDGLYLRLAGVPTYGISGVFIDIDDIRAHGKDERIAVRDYYDGAEYIYRLVKTLSSGGPR
jgi:acetylornithine deacetylase/succinyl-diaminopimelate desuccinylase-like protein